MREIPLSKGMVTIVSDEDYEYVNAFKWSANESGKRSYAIRQFNGRGLYLHRFLLSPPPHLVVDHINGDGLDNRRENLRIVTRFENMQNTTHKRAYGGISGLRYCPTKYHDRWEAFYHLGKKRFSLGYFFSIEEAVIKRERALVESNIL